MQKVIVIKPQTHIMCKTNFTAKVDFCVLVLSSLPVQKHFLSVVLYFSVSKIFPFPHKLLTFLNHTGWVWVYSSELLYWSKDFLKSSLTCLYIRLLNFYVGAYFCKFTLLLSYRGWTDRQMGRSCSIFCSTPAHASWHTSGPWHAGWEMLC